MILEKAKERLRCFGYELKDGDEAVLGFGVQKAESTIKNDCNVSEVPDGLINIAADMAVGEFLTAKKTFAPADISGIDLEYAVKQIQAGDTNTVFAVGSGSLTPEQRLDSFISYLLNYGREQFSCFRRLKW